MSHHVTSPTAFCDAARSKPSLVRENSFRQRSRVNEYLPSCILGVLFVTATNLPVEPYHNTCTTCRGWWVGWKLRVAPDPQPTDVVQIPLVHAHLGQGGVLPTFPAPHSNTPRNKEWLHSSHTRVCIYTAFQTLISA